MEFHYEDVIYMHYRLYNHSLDSLLKINIQDNDSFVTLPGGPSISINVIHYLVYSTFSLIYSILNKLTPERFDKLSLELLNVGINSEKTLRGLIILVGVPSLL